jgi:manganese/iron transport system ATP-binding protein
MTILDEFRKTNYLIRHSYPHEAGAPILRASSLTVSYDSGFALEDVSFELKERERLAVVGPNGAGKSTLFKVISGVLAPTSGQVHVYGHDPEGHICIAYVPQRSQVDWSFPVSVADVVMMGRIGKIRLFRQPKSRDWDIVHHALEVVGMEGFAKRQINELSGGQQQRMFIARAFAQEAELMLMDEPLTGLDLNSQEDIFLILEELRARNVTVLVALHDLRMAAERFDRVILLNHRLLGFGAPDEVFTPEILVNAYGGHLHMVPTEEGTLALGDTCCDDGVHDHA